MIEIKINGLVNIIGNEKLEGEDVRNIVFFMSIVGIFTLGFITFVKASIGILLLVVALVCGLFGIDATTMLEFSHQFLRL